MRYLALDVGDERIGVAISDAHGHMARPLEIVARRAGPSSFMRIAELVAANSVGTIVVGMPLLASGEAGKQAQSCEAYVRGLRAHVEIPIVFCDESGSTRRATEILVENNARRKRRRRATDAVAAAVILQHYLDEQEGGPLL
jgi:putative Holliday junction resolvase